MKGDQAGCEAIRERVEIFGGVSQVVAKVVVLFLVAFVMFLVSIAIEARMLQGGATAGVASRFSNILFGILLSSLVFWQCIGTRGKWWQRYWSCNVRGWYLWLWLDEAGEWHYDFVRRQVVPGAMTKQKEGVEVFFIIALGGWFKRWWPIEPHGHAESYGQGRDYNGLDGWKIELTSIKHEPEVRMTWSHGFQLRLSVTQALELLSEPSFAMDPNAATLNARPLHQVCMEELLKVRTTESGLLNELERCVQEKVELEGRVAVLTDRLEKDQLVSIR